MRPADCCQQHSAEHPSAAVRAPEPGAGSAGRRMGKSLSVRFSGYSFGSVRVDGVTYDHDLIIDRGKIRKRKKGASRQFRGAYGHTPLSAAEDIPWRCRRLVIGTGAAGALPVMNDVHEQARRREVDLVILPTAQAISVLAKTTKDTNAIFHLTCGPASAAWRPRQPRPACFRSDSAACLHRGSGSRLTPGTPRRDNGRQSAERTARDVPVLDANHPDRR